MSQGSFLEALKTYLQRLTQQKPSAEAEELSIDPVWARNLLLRTLERVEKGESNLRYSPKELDRQLDDWQQGDRVVVFAREVARLLKQSLAPTMDDAELRELVALGLARWFSLPGELSSRVLTAQLDRLTNEAKTLAWQTAQVFVGMDVVHYAKANRLTMRKEGRIQVSPLGQVFQRLEGRDAVRWLLQVEIQQSLGPSDPDRLSLDGAKLFLNCPKWRDDSMDDEYGGPCHYKTQLRMSQFGILTVDDVGNGLEYWSVSAFGRELLEEVIGENQTPLSLLAKSLCSDLVSSVVEAVQSPVVLNSSAAEATTIQARMVAHEMRNALLPVQAALDSMYREVLTLPPSEVLARRRKTIDEGVRGALQFAKKLLQTAELGAKPPQPFEAVQAIGEVVESLASTTQIALIGPQGGSRPLLHGRREHFVLAVRNLIQNAIEHGGPELRRVVVAMELEPAQDAIRLIVDDDGQGVEPAKRERIFDEGVTNKPDGTGIGLSSVRQVFERDFQGVVVCSQAPLGGARFVVRLPLSTGGQGFSQKEIKR
ncbi:MAG: HAMP domain-containing histidine kinase [Myxococcales bacterium]|nr:HAMP domain-containing histidine kinase [Myxococcales bacterium]